MSLSAADHATAPAPRPVNQRRRVNILRAAFVLMLPLVLFSAPVWSGTHWLFEVLEVLGTFLIIVAVLGRFWSILYIGGRKNQTVMQDGPYSMCRHPLYFFSTLGVIGFSITLGSIFLTLALGLMTFLILQITAAREEVYLRATFGPAYDSYAARTPRILPNPRLFHTEGEVTFRVDTLRGNFMDALVFLTFIPLAELLKEAKDFGVIPTFPIW